MYIVYKIIDKLREINLKIRKIQKPRKLVIILPLILVVIVANYQASQIRPSLPQVD